MEAAGKRYITHGSRKSEFRLWCLADVHFGNRACDLKRFQRDVKRIAADPNAYWFGGGDYAEYISPRDKRWNPADVDPSITVEDLGRLGMALTERVAKMLEPIKHKCLGLLFGNHESKYMVTQEQQHLHSWLCLHLGVPNLGYCCLFDVVFVRRGCVKIPRLDITAPPHTGSTRRAFRVFAHHGAGGANTPGGKLNRLQRFMDSFGADLYFCGHVHDRIALHAPSLSADADCRHIVERPRLGVITGSYLRTYQAGLSPYGEAKGYRPVPLGASCVRITPETGEVVAET